MIETHKEEKIQTVEKIDDIKCNKCGKSLKHHWKSMTNENMYYDHLTTKKLWGYMSDHDGEYVDYQICQDCFFEYISSFVIPAKIENI